jgi:hypothetical protein
VSFALKPMARESQRPAILCYYANDAIRGARRDLGLDSIKAPGPSFPNHLEPKLVIPIDQHVGHMALGVLVCKLQRVRAIPPGPDYGYQAVRANATYRRIGQEFLESTHRACPTYL